MTRDALSEDVKLPDDFDEHFRAACGPVRRRKDLSIPACDLVAFLKDQDVTQRHVVRAFRPDAMGTLTLERAREIGKEAVRLRRAEGHQFHARHAT